MSKLVILASVFALAAPAAFAAPPGGQGTQAATPSASGLCKQQRRTIGMDAFRALYAPSGTPKAAMDACLSAQKSIAGIVAKNAAQECKVEQAQDAAAFAVKYGKNENDRNALGKCVSAKGTENVQQQQQGTLNAAKQCKAERAQGADAFANKYGTNKNKRNAFGKCVSKLAKEQND